MKKIFLIMISITFLQYSCTKEDVEVKAKKNVTNNNSTISNRKGNEIIPATKNEFYSYSTIFTIKKPLYYMMSCKANKDQPIEGFLSNELDLTILFGHSTKMSSPTSTESIKLLGTNTNLHSTDIKVANISSKEFYNCYNNFNTDLIVKIFNNATDISGTKTLQNNMIITVKSKTGKYGLILIKNVSDTILEVDACHVLL